MENERKKLHGEPKNGKEKLYDFLVDNGVLEHSFSDFSKNIDTSEGRRKMYDFMSSNGLYDYDYDTFSKELTGEKKRSSVKRNDGSVKYFDTKEEGDAWAKANYFDLSLAEPTPMQTKEETQAILNADNIVKSDLTEADENIMQAFGINTSMPKADFSGKKMMGKNNDLLANGLNVDTFLKGGSLQESNGTLEWKDNTEKTDDTGFVDYYDEEGNYQPKFVGQEGSLYRDNVERRQSAKDESARAKAIRLEDLRSEEERLNRAIAELDRQIADSASNDNYESGVALRNRGELERQKEEANRRKQEIRKERYELSRGDISDLKRNISNIEDVIDAHEEDARRSKQYSTGVKGVGSYGTIGQAMSSNIGNVKDNRKKTDEDAYYRNAKYHIREAKRKVSAVEKGATGEGFFVGAWNGFTDAVLNERTWDFGMQDLADYYLRYRTTEKYENKEDNANVNGSTEAALTLAKIKKGEKITDAEDLYLRSWLVDQVADQLAAEYGSMGYKSGKVTGEALPFMLEMFLNPLSAGAKTSTSAVGRAVGAFTKASTARNVATRFARMTYAGNSMQKGASKVMANALGALARRTAMVGDAAVRSTGMALTTGLPKVLGGTIADMGGELRSGYDEQGRIQFAGTENEEGFWTSLLNNTASVAKENFTEMGMGPVGEAYRGVKYATGGAAKKIASSNLAKAIKATGGYKAIERMLSKFTPGAFTHNFNHFLDKTQWHGTLGEYWEEVEGNVLDAIFTDNKNFSLENGLDTENSIFNLDDNIETFLGVALMGGVTSTIATFGYKHSYKVAEEGLVKADAEGKLALGSEWKDIRSMLDSFEVGKKNENGVSDITEYIISLMHGDSYTEKQQKAIFDYLHAREFAKGVNVADKSQKEEASKAVKEGFEQTVQENAQEEKEPEEKYVAVNELDEAANNLVSLEGGEELKNTIDETFANDGLVDAEVFDGIKSVELQQAVFAYMDALAVSKGVEQNAENRITENVETEKERIEPYVDEQGEYEIVSYKGHEWFVKANDGGTLTIEYTDDYGDVHTEMISMSSVAKDENNNPMYSTINFNQYMDDYAQKIRDSIMQTEEEQANNHPYTSVVSRVKMGQQLDFPFNGELSTAMVVGMNERTITIAPVRENNGAVVPDVNNNVTYSHEEFQNVQNEYWNEHKPLTPTNNSAQVFESYTGEEDVDAQEQTEEPTTSELGENKSGKGVKFDEEGEPIFDGVDTGSIANYLADELNADEANQFIDFKVKEAEKNLEKVSKKAPTIASFGGKIGAYRKAKDEYEATIRNAENEVNRWKDVKSKYLSTNADNAQYAQKQKEYEREKSTLDERDNAIGDAFTLEEFIDRQAFTMRYLWKSKGSSRGLEFHTGGKNGERSAWLQYLSNDGVTPEMAAHKIAQYAREAGFNDVDEKDVLDKIIDTFLSFGSRKKVIEYYENVHDNAVETSNEDSFNAIEEAPEGISTEPLEDNWFENVEFDDPFADNNNETIVDNGNDTGREEMVAESSASAEEGKNEVGDNTQDNIVRGVEGSGNEQGQAEVAGNADEGLSGVEEGTQGVEDSQFNAFVEKHPALKWREGVKRSKYMNENGELKTYYGSTIFLHGTTDTSLTLDKLEIGHTRSNGDKANFAGEGISFTGDPSYAEEYAYDNDGAFGSIIGAKIKLKNPYVITSLDRNLTDEEARIFSDMLREQGYDGIIVPFAADSSNIAEVVVFDKSSLTAVDIPYTDKSFRDLDYDDKENALANVSNGKKWKEEEAQSVEPNTTEPVERAVRTENEYGYSSKDYEDERALNKQYSKELSDISSIEDDEKFEEAANVLESKLPSGFVVVWNSVKGAHIVLGEPAVYHDVNGTRRRFNIGDNIQIYVDGRNPHVIVTNIDENGKVIDAIDMNDGRYVIKDGKKLSTNEIIKQDKRISNQKDQNGYPYMLNDEGSVDFGMITTDKNLTEAPVRISLGDAENGYIHIEKRHGGQIRNEGYNGVLEFVQHVLDNFNIIKKGDSYENSKGGINQTYYVTLSDEHNNVLFVQLARDGSYWNINSAGIFRRGYGKNKETIWSASEVQNGGSATTDNALQSKPNAEKDSTSNGTASNVSSASKDTPSSSNEQEKTETVNLNGEEYAVSDIESAVLSHVNSIISDADFDAEIVGVKLIGSRMNGTAREDSDLDVLVEFNGKAKEDTLFNALNNEPLVINGVTVDINPITKGKSGTIEQFLKRNAGYVKESTEESNAQTNDVKTGGETSETATGGEKKQTSAYSVVEDTGDKNAIELKSVPNAPKLNKGRKWNDVSFDITPYNKKKHDAFIVIGGKKYGVTNAELGSIKYLLDTYGSAEAAWNQIELGNMLPSVEEQAILASFLDSTHKEPQQADTHGYKKGDKVMFKGKEATIYDFEHDGRPVLDSGLAPVLYEIANWEDISKVGDKKEEPLERMLTVDEIDAADVDPTLKTLAKSYVNGDTNTLAVIAYQQILNQTKADVVESKPTQKTPLYAPGDVFNHASGHTYTIVARHNDVSGVEYTVRHKFLNGKTETIKMSEYRLEQTLGDSNKTTEETKKDPKVETEKKKRAERKKVSDAVNEKKTGKKEKTSNDAMADINDLLGQIKDLFKEADNKDKKNLYIGLIPGLTPSKMEAVAKAIPLIFKIGGKLIEAGIHEYKEWSKQMYKALKPILEGVLGKEWLDKVIRDAWNAPYEMEGKTKKVSEWAAEKSNKPTMLDLFADNAVEHTEVSPKNETESVSSQSKPINSNNNETANLRTGSSGERTRGQHADENGEVGESSRNEVERTDRGRVDGSDNRYLSNNEVGGSRVSGVSKSAKGSSIKKNQRNNRADQDYAPKSPDARYKANVEAIKTLQTIMSEEREATKEEQAILRKFSGWGGLGGFVERNESELKALIGEDAYNDAVMSVHSAYYTPKVVIDSMWSIVEKLGFKGGNILEGSAGIGNILGLMPEGISNNSDIEAVEIDSITGNILKLLYPDAKVNIQGFEKTSIENGSVDLAITNVPFITDFHVKDTEGDKDLSKKFSSIHDFCIAKNVRKLRAGGIGVFISSNGTLDKSQKLRDWLSKEGNADVVGAFRLNNKTFGGTGATSDIIVIRKRVDGKVSPNAVNVLNIGTERVVTRIENDKEVSVPVSYNEYFLNHPENMGGKMEYAFENGETYHETSLALYPKGVNQEERLAEWVKSFDNMESEATATEKEIAEVAKQNEKLGENVREGSLVMDSKGNICVARKGQAVPLEGKTIGNKVKGHTKAECLKSYNAIKTALAELLDYQTKNSDDKGLSNLISKLNRAYDSFVRTYGHVNKNSALSFLRNDVDFANIAGLENIKEEPQKDGSTITKFTKAEIFDHRVVSVEADPQPKNIHDAITASIFKFGNISLDYIQEHLNKSADEVKSEIINSGLGFENPASGEMEISYKYLSGNVREKLQLAKDNNVGGRYDKNIEALEKALPMTIPAHLIDFNIGSSWIDKSLYEKYIEDRTGNSCSAVYVGGRWELTGNIEGGEKNKAFGVTSESLGVTKWGTTLIEAAMRNTVVTVSVSHRDPVTKETITEVDKEATQACATKVNDIRADFKQWAKDYLRNDKELSKKIEKDYNDIFNNYAPLEIPEEMTPKHFVGSVETMGGRAFGLYPHQRKAVVKATMQNTLLAHEVGTGKTFTLITIAMEMRRLGTAKKPLIAVQNATVGQFVASAKALYPNARILTISEKDMNKEGRKNLYAKIRYNEWDMIVCPQSVLERIPDSKERVVNWINKRIQEKMDMLEELKKSKEGANSFMVKRLENEIIDAQNEILDALSVAKPEKKKKGRQKDKVKAIQNASVRMEELMDRETDDVEDFDSMGIDALLVDEAHEYKHLGFETAMQRGIKGVDKSASKKSQGVYLKCQAVMDKSNGKNVVFATGTPISNTAAEIWTFIRYLMNENTMKEYQMYAFDDFVRNFGNISQMLEFQTNGKFKDTTRFAGYSNLPELVRIWSEVADTVLTRNNEAVLEKQPDTIEGGKKATQVFLPQTPTLRSIMNGVKAELERFEKMSGKEKAENSHIPLVMYGIAKAAAIDPRLVMNDAFDDPRSKTNKAVEETLKALEDTKDYKGTVAIFADSYQNKKTGFNLYNEIKRKLVEAGIPEEQVFIMKSGMTANKKAEVFDKVNRGDIRVILGSTQTLGTGVNIQERLHTLINMDVPNRPMDYTQRLGRILRQGNMHKVWNLPVRILNFGVEDSLDVTGYQRLQTKGNIADSIMNGSRLLENNQEDRTVEEEEDSFGDVVANLSGSQFALLKQKAARDVRKLQAKKQQFEADQIYVHSRIPQLESEIKKHESEKAEAESNLAKVKEEYDGKKVTISVNGNTFTNIDDMGEYIKEFNKKQNEKAEIVRSNAKGGLQGQAKSSVTIKFGGLDFVFNTDFTADISFKSGTLEVAVRRNMTYSCKELGIENMPVNQSLLKNGIEEVMDKVVTGRMFEEIRDRRDRRIERDTKELAQVKSREGLTFEGEEELEKALALYDEYEAKMKEELEEKEAKYKELDAEVDSVSLDTLNSDTEEDEEGENTEKMASSENYTNDTEAKQLVTESVMTLLNENAGVNVVVEDDANSAEDADMMVKSKKRALETVSVASNEAHQPTVVSSANGANVIEKLKTTKEKYKNITNRVNTFIGDVAEALGMERDGSSSEYATFETVNGKIVTIRLANHNAKVSNFDNRDENEGISIVISPKENTKIINDGDAHVVEYFYDAIRLRRANGKPLVEIINSIEQSLYSGVFKDTTGLAQEQEVNENTELLSNNDGVIYGWAEGNTIHLASRGINPNTPVHEYTHLWAKAVMKKAPKLWANVKGLLKQTSVWNEVLNDANYSDIHGNEDAVASEVLSRLSGKNNAEKMEKMAQEMLDEAKSDPVKRASVHSFIAKLKEAVKKFWSWVGKNLFDIESFGSVEEVTDRVLYDLVNKTDLDLSPADGYGAEYARAEAPLNDYDPVARAREIADRLKAIILRRMQENGIIAKEDNTTRKEAKNASMRTLADETVSNITKLRKAMTMQRRFDEGTVDAVADYVNSFLKEGLMPELTANELRRILAQVKASVGREDISKQIDNILDIVTNHQVKFLEGQLDKLGKVKSVKVDDNGVQVQGDLGLRGQRTMKAYRTGITMDDASISDRLSELLDKIDLAKDDAVRMEFEDEYNGLMLATEYNENVKANKAEYADLRNEIKNAKELHDTNQISDEDYKGMVRSLNDAIRENRLDRIDALAKMYGRLQVVIEEGVMEANEFEQARIEHANEIRHYANSDLKGETSSIFEQKSNMDKVKEFAKNNALFRFLFEPLVTFDTILRRLGDKSPEGKGYLWSYFMGKWNDSRNEEISRFNSACDELDKKVSEIFGKGMKWNNLYKLEKDMTPIFCSFYDEGGKRVFKLTPGNAIYIYMVNKMLDGQMKLRKMGISEEDVNDLVAALDPKLVKLADWIQNEFLPSRRNHYNDVHQQLFGAPMKAIENYFPLRINKRSLTSDVDVSEADMESYLPSTKTGAIIKRTRNTRPLDILNADAFDIVVEHLQEMEHWAAFAQMNKDLSTLLSYKKFKNRVLNMNTALGKGNELWNRLVSVSQIAVGSYKPKGKDAVNKFILNVAKGITASKIALRLFTAMKQILSAPAFLTDARIDDFAVSSVTPWKSFAWCYNNLPIFEERWRSRFAGDVRLMKTDMDWKTWENEFAKTAQRVGMSPNALVDAVTCAVGAHAVYKSKYRKYIDIGFDKETADKFAKRDAAISFNESQQSSEGAYVSTVQQDRDILKVVLSLFRNSSMAYTRKVYSALHDLRKSLGNYNERVEFRAKQYRRMGLDDDLAMRAAKKDVKKSIARNAITLGIYGFGLQLLWNLAPNVVYMFFGDDDDKKKEAFEEAAKHARFGTFEGLAGGNYISSFADALTYMGDEKFKKKLQYNTLPELPAVSDWDAIVSTLANDEAQGFYDLGRIAVSSFSGVDPATITDAVAAIYDYTNADEKTTKEIILALSRCIQVPTASTDKLFMDGIDKEDNKYLKRTALNKFSKRYIEYKKRKNMPISPLMSEEYQSKLEEKYSKQFAKKLKEFFSEEAMSPYNLYKEKIKDYPDIEGVLTDKDFITWDQMMRARKATKSAKEAYDDAKKRRDKYGMEQNEDSATLYIVFDKQLKALNKVARNYEYNFDDSTFRADVDTIFKAFHKSIDVKPKEK